MSAETFDYRVQWPSGQRRQGEHRSANSGESGAYRGDRLLREVRDARQLSLRSTLRDPFERLWVREYLHTATLDLWVWVDASASMRSGGMSGMVSGVETAAGLIRAAALSARAVGDRLGIYCADDTPIETCCAPPSRLAAQSVAMSQKIQALADAPGRSDGSGTAVRMASSANGLLAGAGALGTSRSLVFLVSDFHPERTNWRLVMQSLVMHDVVPIVIWNLPGALAGRQTGLMSLQDAETGRDRMVWMRDSLRQRMIKQLDEHFDSVERLCRSHGRRAVHLYDGFEPLALTRYFLGAHQVERPAHYLSQLSQLSR
ncbi:MAG: hypothetical protein AB8C46_20600 [Burkholderiaceae bacterium]